jgi:cyclic pyranopterin phosphate synthase
VERLTDMFGRTVGDLRISVTDRCNFRCTYCMPEDYADWLPRESILSFEEIGRVVGILSDRFGIHTVRLTGGEPLMRRDVHRLVALLRGVDPDLDISLTTNGFFLADQAAALATAGLRRVNVSLDTLRRDRFCEITRRDHLPEVLDGIAAAKAAGLEPVKVNVVAMRGKNDDEVLDIIEWARDGGYQVRFIEFMPLDGGHTWTSEQVFSKREILDIVGVVHPFEAVGVDEREPAQRFRFLDGSGEFGIIGSVTEPFCDNCDRIRLTADGMFRTCLFSLAEHDLKSLLRGDASDDEIADFFRAAVLTKEAGHRIGKPGFVQPDRPMVAIGG